MSGGYDNRKLVEVFQKHMLWHALLSEVLNLWILLPENNLLSGSFSWLVGWLVDSGFFPTNSIVICAFRS